MVDPKYLEAMSLLMAECSRSSEGCLHCIHCCVEPGMVVLDKDYMNMQRKLRKLSGKECAELIDKLIF